MLPLQGLEDKSIIRSNVQPMIDVTIKHNGDAKIIFSESEGPGAVNAENVESSVVEQEEWWSRTLGMGY